MNLNDRYLNIYKCEKDNKTFFLYKNIKNGKIIGAIYFLI